MLLGVVFNSFFNSQYKFTMELKTPTKGIYLEFSEYLDFINGVTISEKGSSSISIDFNELKEFLFPGFIN